MHRLQALYGKQEHPLKKQKAAFSIQKRNAKQRGIPFLFTFQEWWAWWQIDNRWENRGMGRDKFVMARRQRDHRLQRQGLRSRLRILRRSRQPRRHHRQRRLHPIPAPTPTPTPEPTPAPTEPSTISTINGTSGNDIFTGTSVAEKIVGKGGMDLLTGGTGSDTFAFDTALGTSNVVTITDFTPGIDKIEFSSKVFTSLWVQELGTDVFRVGTAADHNDHILYNQATGALYYDADGNGSGAAVQFAKVAAGLALSASDFYTI